MAHSPVTVIATLRARTLPRSCSANSKKRALICGASLGGMKPWLHPPGICATRLTSMSCHDVIPWCIHTPYLISQMTSYTISAWDRMAKGRNSPGY